MARWTLALMIAGVACGGSSHARSTAAPAATQDPPAPPPPPAPQVLTVPPAGALYHGVLPAGSGPTDTATDASEAALDAYEQAVGRKVAYVYFSHEWMVTRAFPTQTVTWIRKRGAIPFIRLMLRSQRDPLHFDPVFTLDRIIAGEFDQDLAAWADAARTSGPMVVEYGTEVNGDWNPWSAPYNSGLDTGPAKFQKAYRHIVDIMRGRGASNITWALHYNAQPFPADPRNVPAAYYPGDDVVDWVGVSAYGSERSTDHRCNSLRSLLDAIVPQLRAATAAKPLFVFEFGNTSTNAACPAGPWVTAALDDLLGNRWPDIRGFAWWQQRWNDDGAKGTDMQVQDDPSVAAAFQARLSGADVIDAPLLH